MPIRNLISMRFGKLRVAEFVGTSRHHKSQWLCICDCGNGTVAIGGNLTSGVTQSCGCYDREINRLIHTKHGMRYLPEYRVWCAMIRRCSSPKDPAYHNYGERGISVCERWKDFSAFMQDMGIRPSPEHTIERKDNGQGYSKENCVWDTRRRQARNTRQNNMITHLGKTQCLTDWAEEFGIKPRSLQKRLTSGWSIDRALSEPIPSRLACNGKAEKRLFTIDGETLCLAEWARRYNIGYATVSSRLRYGWDILRALITPIKEKIETSW